MSMMLGSGSSQNPSQYAGVLNAAGASRGIHDALRREPVQGHGEDVDEDQAQPERGQRVEDVAEEGRRPGRTGNSV